MAQQIKAVIPSTVPNLFTADINSLTGFTQTYNGEGIVKGFILSQTAVASSSIDIKVDPVDGCSQAFIKLIDATGDIKRVVGYNQNFNLVVPNTNSLPRNDLVVIKYTTDPNISDVVVDIIVGTPNASPVDPVLPDDDDINYAYLIIGAIRRLGNRNDVVDAEIITTGNTTNGSGEPLRSIPIFVYLAGSPTNGLVISNSSGIATNSGKLITNAVFSNENTFFTKSQTSNPQTLSISSGSITWSLNDSNYYTLALTANTVFNNPSNLQSGRGGSIYITQDSTGNRKINWGTIIPAIINQNILGILWTSGNTLRITFDTSFDLSGIIVGQSVAYISGCTNAVNNSPANQGFAVTAFDNSAKWIEITNPSISTNATNETSSPGILTIANSVFRFIDGIPVQPAQAANSESVISFMCQPGGKIFVTATPEFKLT